MCQAGIFPGLSPVGLSSHWWKGCRGGVCTDVPHVVITDKLKSYGATKRAILPGVEHRQHRYLNNRAENSHQPGFVNLLTILPAP